MSSQVGFYCFKMTDFCIWELDNQHYLLIDKVTAYTNYTEKKSVGSFACRQLLQQFQQQKQWLAPLQEQIFPYFFDVKNQRYFVSFSHSKQHIAVLISIYPNIGVDIEDKIIAYPVAKRFFHIDEVDWLNSLSEEKQILATKLLWTMKESLIKTGLYAKDLPTGLGQSLFTWLSQDDLEKFISGEIWQKKINHLCFGFLPNQYCSFVMNKKS